jgi:hypothetical protein
MDSNFIKFGGPVVRIAEDEFSARASSELAAQLYNEWKSSGSPPDHEKWIRTKLAEIFVWVVHPPKWPRDAQEWPEHESSPMMFLGQLQIPEYSLPTGHKSPASILFVFGAPDGPPNEWSLITKTIDLLGTLKGAKITKVIRDVDKI